MAAARTPREQFIETLREQFGSKSFLQRVRGIFKWDEKQKVEPEGEPLPEWEEDRIAPITRGDIEEANRRWDENSELPDRARGILEARQAGREEIADAVAKGHGG